MVNCLILTICEHFSAHRIIAFLPPSELLSVGAAQLQSSTIVLESTGEGFQCRFVYINEELILG
jgi:hypothetical protein